MTLIDQEPATADEGKTLNGLGRASRLQGLFEGGSTLLLASIFGNGMNYLFMMFLARQLGMEEFGLYALGLTVFNSVMLLAMAGLDAGAVKFTAERQAQEGGAAVRRLVPTVVLAAVGAGLLGGLGLWLAAGPLASGLYEKSGLELALRWFAGAVPAMLLTGVALSLLQAHQRVRDTVLVKYVWEPFGKWLLAGGAVLLGWGLAGALGALLVTTLFSAVLAMAALVRTVRFSLSEVWSVNEGDIRALAVFCAPLFFSNVFGVLAPRTDVLVLGYWASSHDVGMYLAAFQTAAMLALVLGAFDVVFAPLMSRAWATQDERAFRDSYTAVHRIAVMVATPFGVCLLLFGHEIMAMFGLGFVSGAPILAVLACGHLTNCATGCSNTVLLMTGRSRLVLLNTIAYGVVFVAGALWLIPRWGAWGAAVVASGSLIGLNGLRVWQVWRLYRMMPWTWATLKPLAAGASVAVILWALKPFVEPVLYAPLMALGIGFYGLGLYGFRLESDDRSVMIATWKRFRLARN
ncbi:MAG: flippase [Nitrospira sp.]|nr:flippase [Nitrospira sp.]